MGRGPGASVCPGDRLFSPYFSRASSGSFLFQVWTSRGRQDNPTWEPGALDIGDSDLSGLEGNF